MCYIDELDKKLLLSIQSECNAHNIALPWNDIGETLGNTMGERVTGGAVIQHLAKLRTRMVAENLSVPPPLRRGGGNRISNSTNNTRTRPSVAATSTLPSNATKKLGTVAKKRRAPLKEESEDSDEDNLDSNSDAEYGKPISKRAKSSGKKRTSPKVKKEKHDSDNDDTNKHSSDSEANLEDDDDEYTVAAGASFLALEEDDVPIKGKIRNRTMQKPSLIVSLDMRSDGQAYIKKAQAETHSSFEDNSEESAQTQDTGEGNAARALVAISSKDKSVAAPPPSLPSPYLGLSEYNGSAPGAIPANSSAFNPFGYGSIGSVRPAFGGLPPIDTNAVGSRSFYNFGHHEFIDNLDMHTEPGTYNSMLHNDFGYDSGFVASGDHGNGHDGMAVKSPNQGSFGFEINDNHGAPLRLVGSPR